MQTQAFQLTLYLPDDVPQPAVALPKPDRPRVKNLSIREAAIQYLGELPDGEKLVTRLLHYGASSLATDELLTCVFGLNGHDHADAQHLLSAFDGLPGGSGQRLLDSTPGWQAIQAVPKAQPVGSDSASCWPQFVTVFLQAS